MAKPVVITVALSSGSIPKREILGCHTTPVKNSHNETSGVKKKRTASSSRMKTMPIVVKIVRAAQAKRKARMIASPRWVFFFKE